MIKQKPPRCSLGRRIASLFLFAVGILVSTCAGAVSPRWTSQKPVVISKSGVEKIINFHKKITGSYIGTHYVLLDAPLTLKAGIPFLGRVRIYFDRLRIMKRHSVELIGEDENRSLLSKPPLLLRGWVEKNGIRLSAISGSINKNIFSVQLLKDLKGRPLEFWVDLSSSPAAARIRRGSSFSMHADCPEDSAKYDYMEISGADNSAHELSFETAQVSTTMNVVEIAVEGDYEFYGEQGSDQNNATTAIAELFNSVEALYEDQLNITFEIVSERLYTSASQPYTASETDSLLEQLMNETSGIDSDLKHLITGKDIYATTAYGPNTSVAGVAYVGVLCTTSYQNVGISEYISSEILRTVVTAHEIGHNLGSQHSPEYSIMYSMALGSEDYLFFADDSVDYINSHIAAYGGACLSTTTTGDGGDEDSSGGSSSGGDTGAGSSSDDPYGLILETSLNKKKGKAKLTLTANTDLTGCTAEFKIASKSDMSNVRSLGLFGINGNTVQIQGKKKKKVSKGKVYTQVTVTCGSRTVDTDIVRISGVKKIKFDDEVKAKKWIKLKSVKQNY